jgi:LacI family transcriptional regulator
MKPDHAATLRDVARLAGKSVATVSRALRNHPAISEPTRQLIQRSALRAGYQRHPMVSALMTRIRERRPVYQETLACLFSARGLDRNTQICDSVLVGAKAEALRIGYTIDLFSLEEPTFSVRTMLHAWWSHRVRGVFLFNTRPSTPFDLPWNDCAWVVSGNITGAPKLHRVGNEIYDIMKLGIKELYGHGYRRPVLALSTGGAERVGFRWVGAFLANAMHYSLEVSLDSIFPGELSLERFASWYHRLRPDVVLSLEDRPKQWLDTMGESVPEKTGFLHLAANVSCFAASGVIQDFAQVGKAAIQSLDAGLRRNDLGVPSAPISSTIPGTWREGATLRNQTRQTAQAA